MKQYGFYIDSSKCTGCKTCQISCKDEKNIDVGPKLRRVYEYGGGSWIKSVDGSWTQDVFAYYLSISCNHCSHPTCVTACSSGALFKRQKDGLVVINEQACNGCRACESYCPYGALQFYKQKNIIIKCDGCYQRVDCGLNPVCVDACPQRALDFDDINILRQRYGCENAIAPLPCPAQTQPNLVIKPHRDAKPIGDQSGKLQNELEV